MGLPANWIAVLVPKVQAPGLADPTGCACSSERRIFALSTYNDSAYCTLDVRRRVLDAQRNTARSTPDTERRYRGRPDNLRRPCGESHGSVRIGCGEQQAHADRNRNQG